MCVYNSICVCVEMAWQQIEATTATTTSTTAAKHKIEMESNFHPRSLCL